jgi:hypothetical protein
MRKVLAAIVASVSMGCATAAAAEELVLRPYPGPPAWKLVTNKVAGLQFLRELIPADQRIEAYRDILSAQSFPQNRGVDPSVYLRNVFAAAGQACDGLRLNGPTARREGGRAVAYGQIYCGRQKGQASGAIMLFKAISGADSLYVVQREFRVPPSATPGVVSGSAAEMAAHAKAAAAADAYLLNSVYLCGAGTAEPRCARR